MRRQRLSMNLEEMGMEGLGTEGLGAGDMLRGRTRCKQFECAFKTAVFRGY
jgi:hypothetical protein